MHDVTDAQFAALVAAGRDPAIVAQNARAAQEVFDKGVVSAAQTIVELAQNAENPKVRLDAAKYVVERIMGRVVAPTQTSEGSEWEKLLRPAIKEPSKYELEGEILP